MAATQSSMRLGGEGQTGGANGLAWVPGSKGTASTLYTLVPCADLRIYMDHYDLPHAVRIGLRVGVTR